jgi:flagellar hook assembly protein FlgD
MYAMKVKVKDASNNNIQNNDYTINFEVINESSITHFFPYPNPFTTQTQFVFTLTGESVPEDIKIQIMTISGKIVKEIRKAELGAIKIGHNITDYRWNGTDEYGNRLANGVYLYRVTIKDNNSFKERATDADKYFSQGFGKIYLMK